MTSQTPLDPTPRTRRNPNLHVDPEQSPGWISGSERVPEPGERIYTHEGTGVVIRLTNKTADGGRVLEVSMDDGRKPPFFAATANVRVRPLVPDEESADEEAEGGTSTDRP